MKKWIISMSFILLLFLIGCSEEEQVEGLLENIPEKYIEGPDEGFYGNPFPNFKLTEEEIAFIEENIPHILNQKRLLLEVYDRYYDKDSSSYTLEEIDNLIEKIQVYQQNDSQEEIREVRPEIGFMISAGANTHYLLVQLKEQKFVDKFQTEDQRQDFYFSERSLNEIIDQVMFQYVMQVKPIVETLEDKENE